MSEYRDTDFSHGYLNYVYSLLQGKMAAVNMLVRFSMAEDQEVQEIRDQLAEVSEWLADLWKGVCIFSTEWRSPETFEAKQLLRYLGEMQEELRVLRDDMAALYQIEDLAAPLDSEIRGFLVAAFGRAVYSKDNYVRGLKKLAEFCGRKEAVETTNRTLKEHEQNVQLAHSFLSAMSGSTEVPAELDRELLLECSTLTGNFGCQLHDISQMIAFFDGGFSYEKGEIPFDEQAAWRSLGAPPTEAGYWHASGLSPQAALQWRQLGVLDHNIAGLWTALGFSPVHAAPWHFAGFHPRRAFEWNMANFIPEQALELVRIGYRSPRAVPQDVEERVRKEIDRPFGYDEALREQEAESGEHDYWSSVDDSKGVQQVNPLPDEAHDNEESEPRDEEPT